MAGKLTTGGRTDANRPEILRLDPETDQNQAGNMARDPDQLPERSQEAHRHKNRPQEPPDGQTDGQAATGGQNRPD